MRTAAYCRYSSDQQRSASIEDQLRNIRNRCEHEGWRAPVTYQDCAISGARNDRPDYLRLLQDAHKFDVILVDDTSRLSRDSIEVTRAIRRLTFAGVRVIGVSDGLDTRRKGHKADVGLRGLMGELYLDDLREKVHRGLTGLALSGASAGGLPYGYRVNGTGQRAIDEAQAAIGRRIYAVYLAGARARAIAIGLNRDKVPSPRGSTWAASAIHGDVRRGIGILANPLYCGRQVWNRSRWEKHPESGRRVRRERPQSEWITTEHPELAIISPEDFRSVQSLLRCHGVATGTPGRPPRHILSGILRCGGCGGPMAIVDAYRYGCSTAKERGTCPAPVRVKARLLEDHVLAGVRSELLSPRRFAELKRAIVAALKRAQPDAQDLRRKVGDAERERDNLVRAIRQGIVTPSIRNELVSAEAAVDEAQRALSAARQPATVLPDLLGRWRRIVKDLSERARNMPAARAALREIVGDQVILRNENGALVAEIAPNQISMVAGAGFEPATFGL